MPEFQAMAIHATRQLMMECELLYFDSCPF